MLSDTNGGIVFGITQTRLYWDRRRPSGPASRYFAKKSEWRPLKSEGAMDAMMKTVRPKI